MISRRRFVLDSKSIVIRIIMSTLLLSILGLSISAQPCSVWKEIEPCTCTKDTSRIMVTCERMTSYDQVFNILQNKFLPTDRIVLKIGLSMMEDLPQRSFKELNMSIENIQLNHDNLRELSAYSFLGLTNVHYFSLADNNLGSVPEHILEKLPNVKTLDLGRTGIRQLSESSFRNITTVNNIILGGNLISQMEITSLPPTIRQLHLGRNKIKDLNNTLANLTDLEWLFINSNELTSLENQLPVTAQRLMIIHAGQNKIEKLPQRLKTYTNLQSLFLHNNLITSLDGTLSKLRKLERAQFEHNRISVLTEEDFLETESLQCLCMGNNLITSLNNSALPLRGLTTLNLTHNLLTTFSLEEIKGLQNLRLVDLSYNKISKLTGPTANLVEWETKVTDLLLNNNDLVALDGALSGLPSLKNLNLSFNRLAHISPDDLIGLDQLQVLDISHNQLTTLEEMGMSFLPSLRDLIASHNFLTVLDRDFHGLPVLCWADLSSNKVKALGRDLVSKTRCKKQDTYDVLKVLLQDNPILCDAALPEIVAAMEINHTRIHGVSHCPPLSEQPTTSKPNGFLGFIPENVYGQPDLNTYNINSLNKQPVYEQVPLPNEPANNDQSSSRSILDIPLPLSEPKITSKSEPLRSRVINQPSIDHSNQEAQPMQYGAPSSSHILNFNQHETSNLQQDERKTPNHLGSYTSVTQPIVTNQQNDLPIQDQYNKYPLPLFQTQSLDQKFPKDKSFMEQPQNEQPIIQQLDPISQEQLSELASKIEQLRQKVEELTIQNKILSHTMNQSPSSGVTLTNEESRTHEDKSITPEQIAIRSLVTEKTPIKLEELEIS